jgi:peptidoglycan/LPS O-acetylase OafA/YrhL
MTDRPPTEQRRWSGLDGLRALAVVAVAAFHFAPGVVSGGFLGVDVFFVLSGYLITRMITAEYLRTGELRFGSFYRRRARRLLPGLAVVLVSVLAAAAFWRDQLGTVRAATAAAAGYVSNWWLTFVHQSYFVSVGRPSMLQHLWSLAVEEQFYLLWPLIAVTVLGLAGRIRGPAATPELRARWLALTALALALGSAGEMTVLAVARDVPYGADATRLYYGTDTHSMGLLLGAGLGALAAARVRPRPGPGGRPRRRLVGLTDVLATGALAALAVAVGTVPESSRALYRGGFLAVAALAAILVAAVARPGSRLGAALDRRALRWLAARSYAIYLWHWPVAVVTRPGVDVHWPAPVVLLVRIGATMLLADLTHRFVEAPIRTLGLKTSVRRGVRRLSRVVAGQAPVGARLATAMLVMVLLLAAAVIASGPKPALSPGQRAVAAAHGGRRLPIGPAASPLPLPDPTLQRTSPPLDDASAPRPTSTPSPVAATHPAARLPAISAFGDSVMLGARMALDQHFPGGTLNAVEGRQADPILRDIENDAAAGRLNPLVIIGVGDNGYINAATLRHALGCLGKAERVIVVNNRVGREWQNANNRIIARVVPKFGNATILDWHAASAKHPSWFYDDGIHLTRRGAAAYSALIAGAARRPL